MRKLALGLLVVLFAGGLVFTVGACGGGGGGGGVIVPPSLSGLYCWSFWQGNPGGPDAECHWGTVTGDGVSMIAVTNVFQNDNGTVSGPIGSPPLTYTIGAGNAMTVTAGGTTLAGGIAADSSLAVLGITTASDPAVLVLGKKGSGFSNASLQGDYHIAAFFDNGGGQVSWFNGTVGFDGAGNGTTLDVDVNSNGSVNMPGALAAGTYTVGADGQVVWTTLGGPFEGGLFGGGEVAVLTGSTMNGVGLQFLIILVRKGAGLNAGTFSGTYHSIALFGEDSPPPLFESATFISTVDGAGSLTVGAGTINSDGTPMPIPAGGTVPYTVAPDGFLDLGAGVVVGAVSQSGRYAVLAGGTAMNSDPQLWFLVR